jgi:hypothetical protein
MKLYLEEADLLSEDGTVGFGIVGYACHDGKRHVRRWTRHQQDYR